MVPLKIGLVGPTYQERSIPFDAQRTINLYPVFDQSGKEVAALYGTPGLNLFATCGAGPVRGGIAAANGRTFVVSAESLYELNSLGTATVLGSLDFSIGTVSIVENGLQLGICDGISLYIYTYSTGEFLKVSDADLPPCGTVAFIDGYFVVNKNSSGSFYISSLYEGSTWSALDFATAESSPDELLRVFSAVGQLWLFGTFTTEIWTNTGDSSFPFQRIAGAKMETGILAPHTAVAVDNSVFWVGKDIMGQGVVYRAKGFTPQRVSTSAIELLIQRATDPANIRAFSYQQDGHVFYFLTGGGLETSLVFDISTGQWHERAYLNSGGNFEQHRAAFGMFAFSKQIIGDRENGKIYEMRQDVYSDNGDAIARERIFTHLSDENIRKRYNSLEIAMETGVGLQSGQGSDPQAVLYISKDGGRTYTDGFTASIGAVGKYLTRVIFRRLGVAISMTFKLRITDPVRVALIGSYLK